MLKNLCDELQTNGWAQLVKSSTHQTNREGVVSESLIDHIWTNSPQKVARTGQEELASSEHQLVWVERTTRQLVERVKKIEKRSRLNYRKEDLERMCRQEQWEYEGTEERSEKMLEARVERLEDKIQAILEKVAPMKTKTLSAREKPKWLTPEMQNRRKEKVRLRKKASRSKKIKDEHEARKVRNESAKEMKNAKLEYLRKKLENLDRNSPDSWAAVGEYLGWRKPVSPTMLVQDGKVLIKGQELAEAMLTQYVRKEEEVNRALGEAKGDYLRVGRNMTEGNTGVFKFAKITKKEVEKQIQKVENKESFGHDKISYGYIKKMSKWIAGELTDIMNLSLEVKKYPKRWKIARVKPLYKGDGCDRQAPKSYRPVALLSGMSRIMEAILARQLDNYQEEKGLVHQGVHGFRKGRGTNTAMLEVWEYVLRKTEKGELVALDFLDVSAGFDTLVHLYILRKMEVHYGMEQDSLEWLSSYLEGWLQYTVVEATNSSTRRMKPKGAPQGGGLSPILWRSSTNDIPESGLVEKQVDARGAEVFAEDSGLISRKIDEKSENEKTTEEKLDSQLRKEGVWKLETWRKERTGEGEVKRNGLRQKMREDPRDVLTTIFADDTQSRASAKTKAELERRNSEGLTRICRELKTMRLKVNEGKTTYMVLASLGRRRLEDLDSEIMICGEVVKNVKVGKSLGLLVSDDLTWRHQTEKVVKSCRDKLAGLWKCTEVLKKHQRKIKAEAIIMSRLSYCLEVVSTGRKKDMEKLQGVQSAAARWVAQTRSRDWHLKSGLKRLGWLSMCQQAAYASLKTAMKVLREKKPERLYETLVEAVGGEWRRKVLD